jgi:hypothetical protein
VALKGGQLWRQPRYPHVEVYIVFHGNDCWSRIEAPHRSRGCITYANRKGQSIFSGTEMKALLQALDYELVGDYAEWHIETFQRREAG